MLFKPFTELRNIIEKEGPITPKFIKQNVSFGQDGITGKGKEVVNIIVGDNECRVTKTLDNQIIEEKVFNIDYELIIQEQGDNVIKIDNFITRSKDYINALELMVAQCKKKFLI